MFIDISKYKSVSCAFFFEITALCEPWLPLQHITINLCPMLVLSNFWLTASIDLLYPIQPCHFGSSSFFIAHLELKVKMSAYWLFFIWLPKFILESSFETS